MRTVIVWRDAEKEFPPCPDEYTTLRLGSPIPCDSWWSGARWDGYPECRVTHFALKADITTQEEA